MVYINIYDKITKGVIKMLEKILLIVLIISLIFIFMVIIISPIFAWIIYKKIFDQRFIKEKYLKYYTAEELGLEKKIVYV